MEALPFTDMIQAASNVDTLLIEWIKDNPDWFGFPLLTNSFNMAATSTAHSSLLCSQLLACHAILPVWHAKRKLQRRLCSLMLSLLWCSRWLMFLSSVHQHHGQCFVLLSLIISSKILCLNTTSYHSLRWFIPKDFFVSQARRCTQKTNRTKNQVTRSI